MMFKRFFQDSGGKVVVAQPPNLLITAWFILSVSNTLIFHGKPAAIPILATATLFAWAYNELRSGVSQFRQLLGAVVLLIIIVGLFIH